MKKTHKVGGITIQEYGNGSYAYFQEAKRNWTNIPSELAKKIIKLKQNHA